MRSPKAVQVMIRRTVPSLFLPSPCFFARAFLCSVTFVGDVRRIGLSGRRTGVEERGRVYEGERQAAREQEGLVGAAQGAG